MPRRAGRPHTVPLAAGDSTAEAYLHQNEQGGPCDFDMSGAGLRGLPLTACQWPAVCGQEMPGCACVESSSSMCEVCCHAEREKVTSPTSPHSDFR